MKWILLSTQTGERYNKKGLSGAGIRSYGSGVHRHSLVQRDSLTCGLGTRRHLQINALESQKGARQQKGHAATQRSKCLSADAEHNVLASATLFQTRSFWFGPSLSPSNKSSLYNSSFPCERFICGGSSRVVAQVRPHETQREPFSL